MIMSDNKRGENQDSIENGEGKTFDDMLHSFHLDSTETIGFARKTAGIFAQANGFCSNCGNAVSALAVACLSCGAHPQGHKKFCRQCSAKLNPDQIICIKCGAGLTAAGDSIPQPKTLNTFFTVYWIFTAAIITGFCLAALTLGLALTLTMVSMPMSGYMSDYSAIGMIILVRLFSFAVMPAAVTGLVFAYILLYQLWKLIPADIARTTPGMAVGLCFIPVFNLYWCFVAWHGLGKDMNETLERNRIQYHVNTTLGFASCSLFVFAFIFFFVFCLFPLICILLETATMFVTIFFLRSVKNGAIALLERE